MKFIPPRCPYRECVQFERPEGRFYVAFGSYWPKCRRRAVPRFRCKSCRRTFSRQTFRHDYRDQRPECNVPLFEKLVSGTGLRQCGRMLGMDIRAVRWKFHKIARTCKHLHRNQSGELPPDRAFVLDEEETYEKTSIKPLTMPVVVDRETHFVVSSAVGPIRRLAELGTARRCRQDAMEARHGPRRDRSRRCVQAVLADLHRRLPSGSVTLLTDEKISYPFLITKVFGNAAEHATTSSTLARGTFNPLFPINLAFDMMQDNCGRLRRKSWLVTERRRCLQFHAHLFTVYRNYVRRRFNYDQESDTPAVLLGLADRPLRPEEVLGWRQDWGAPSPSPCRRTGRPIAV